jgi:hypothetical protein
MKAYLYFLAFALVILAVLVGCGDDASEPEATAEAAAVPTDLVLSQAPADARGVAAVRGSARAGEAVVMTGVVGGRVDPIAEDRAIFTLIDDSVMTCDKMGDDDHCSTPWDACCVPGDDISANAATIQVVDEDGRPLTLDLEGVGGLAPLSRVIVTGIFEPSPDGAAAVVNATGFYVMN